MPQFRRMDKFDSSLDIELGITTSYSPSQDHDLAQNAISLAANTHAKPYTAPLDSWTASPLHGYIAQSGEPISPLDLNDRKQSVVKLADLFEAYAMIPRIRATASCLDPDLSPRSKPALSKCSRSLDDVRIATPSTELHRYKHDHIDCLDIGQAATVV